MSSATQAAASAPGVRLSQISLAGQGDVGNSVNLFRGDVNFPLNLVSIQGRNDLNVAVTAFYGSNVSQQVSTWNMSAPTDVLGVGWSLPFEKIVVDNQATGTNIDDTFYLVAGGSPQQLVRTGVDGEALVYELLAYQFWHIRYFPNPDQPELERWEIVKEDGSTFTYGLTGIQWGIKWKNWIGSSTRPNGQMYPVAWNLVKIGNLQHDTVTFSYENVEVALGLDEQVRYTQASRLKRVTDIYGQTVDFVYEPKEAFEIQPPAVPPGKQNAFQYQYQGSYLKQIRMSNEQGDLQLVTRFNYDFLNVAPSPHDKDEHYRKRYLHSLTQENATGDTLPGISFAYYERSDDVNPGGLKSVTYPQGGIVTYTYEARPLLNSATRQHLSSPGSGYAPQVWYGAQYVVVTWYNATEHQLVQQVCSWGGSWRVWEDMRNWYIEDKSLQVLTGDGFYALSYKDTRTGNTTIRLLRSDPYRFGEWERTPYPVTLDGDMRAPVMGIGRSFFAVADSGVGQLKIVSWNLELKQWNEATFSTRRASSIALAVGASFCLGAYYDTPGQSLLLSLYHADAENRWINSDEYTEDVPIDWQFTTSASLLALGTSFASVTFIKSVDTTRGIARYGVRLLPWSETFQFEQVLKNDHEQDLKINNPIGFSIIQGNTVGNAQHLYRFDGAAWQTIEAASPRENNQYFYTYSSDAVVATTKSSAGDVTYRRFSYSPYSDAWAGETGHAHASHGAASDVPLPTVNGDFLTIGNTLYYRQPTLAWTPIYTIPGSANLTTLMNRAPSYLAYQDKANENTFLLLLKDGGVQITQELPGEKIAVTEAGAGQILAGPDSFITYRGTDFAKATSLFLYRVVGGELEPHLEARTVTRLSIDDGYATLATFLRYEDETATYDPYGLVAQFVRVQSFQGDAQGSEGYTEQIFFNGLSPEVDGVIYPPTDEFTNARNFFSNLNGQLYQKNVFDAHKRKVQTSTIYPYTYTNENSDYPCVGALTRQRKTLNTMALPLFESDPAYAASLSKGTVPEGLRAEFAAKGFPLTTPIRVVSETNVLWTLTDAQGKAYQALLENNLLTLYGWITDTSEYEYNSKAQLARTISLNIDANGQQERLMKETQFAWEVYPELESLNLLAPGARITSRNVSKNVVTAIAVTTFTNDWPQNTIWAPSESFLWKGDSQATGFDFYTGQRKIDPGEGWIKTSQVLAITRNALPITSLDIDNQVGGTLFDKDERFPVAIIANANHLAGEANYYGFEPYEDARGWTITPAGEKPETFITTGDAFTGTRRLSIPGNPTRRIGLTNSFSPAHAQQTFLLSCWIKTEPGFVEDPALAAWQIIVTGSQGKSTPRLTTIPATQGTWRYFHLTFDPTTFGVGNVTSIALEVYSQQNGKYLLVDNLAFVPVLSHCEISVYDPSDKSLTATLDALGTVRRIAYDYLQRPVGETVGEQPRSLWVDYLWRQHTSGSFKPTDPGSSLMIGGRGSGSYTDFRHGDEWQTIWETSADWSAQPGKLSYTGNARGTVTLRHASTRTNYVTRCLLSLDEAVQQPLGFTFGQIFTIQWHNGRWSLSKSDGTVLATADQPKMTSKDLLLMVGQHGVLFFADGRLLLQAIFAEELAGAVTFFTENRLTLRWLAVLSEPVTTIKYTDNTGKTLQTQALDDQRVNVVAQLYDSFGRAFLLSKSAAFEQTLCGYRPDFTAALDPQTGTMGDCELTRAYPDDENYPFFRLRFTPSPMASPIEQSQPGKDLALNPSVPLAQRHTTRTIYRLNVHDGLLDDLTPGQYGVQTIIDADGRAGSTFTNRLGQTVASLAGRADAAPDARALTRFTYDVYGNLRQVSLPNAFTDIPEHNRFVETRSYDFLGNVIQSTQPDTDSPAVNVYDASGRVRFFQTAAGVAGGFVNYSLYEPLGRILEEGICRVPWDRQLFEQHANDKTWLPATGLWARRYVYDGDGSQPNLIGRLWKSLVGTGDGSAALSNETIFAYDSSGQIATRTVLVPGYDNGSPHTSSFSYDLAGNVTRVVYDAENAGQKFAVNYHRNGFNDVTLVEAQVGNDVPVPLARYIYRADGRISREIFNPASPDELFRDYAYSPAGWQRSIQDRFFSETVQYTSGGYDGAGYYSGKAAQTTSHYSGVDQPGFVNDYTYSYAYDALGRLQVAKNSASDQWSLGDGQKLTYDANSNTLDFKQGNNQQHFTYYPGQNRLRNTDGGADQAYTFDGDGSMKAALPNELSDMTYDPASGLMLTATKANPAGPVPSSFTYDAFQNRILKVVENTRRLVIPHPNGQPLIARTSSEDGGETTDFLVYGPAGLLTLRRSGSDYHILRGRLGSTRGLYAGNELVAAYNYLPYGGFLGDPYEKSDLKLNMPYLFTGQEFDPESGLYHFRVRYYDPLTGRFLSIDPANQFASPYLYAGGDPINLIDPDGAFSWSWEAFGAVLGGILAIAGGIALTIFTAGAATPLMVGLGILGGGLIGAGLASAGYGFTHADADTSKFDVVEWGIMVGLGFGFGAVSAGVGFAFTGASTLAALGIETAIGMGMGGLDGLVTNGALNSYHNVDFFENAGASVGFGVLGGAIGGGIGGVMGRGPMLKTSRLVNQARGLVPGARGRLYVATQSTEKNIWHTVVGTNARSLNREDAWFTDLVFADDVHLNVKNILKGGQKTEINAGDWDEVVEWAGSKNWQYTRSISAVALPRARVQLAEDYAQDLIEESTGPFHFLTNGCTSWGRTVVRQSGIEPPLWVLSATQLENWVRRLGTQVA